MKEFALAACRCDKVYPFSQSIAAPETGKGAVTKTPAAHALAVALKGLGERQIVLELDPGRRLPKEPD